MWNNNTDAEEKAAKTEKSLALWQESSLGPENVNIYNPCHVARPAFQFKDTWIYSSTFGNSA